MAGSSRAAASRAQSDNRQPLPGPRRHAWGDAVRSWKWQAVPVRPRARLSQTVGNPCPA